MEATPAPAAEGPSEQLVVIDSKSAAPIAPSPVAESSAMDTDEHASSSEPKGKEPMKEQEAAAEPEPAEEKITMEKAPEKLAEAKRHMACHDYPNAADCFSAVLAAYVEHYGELAPECAELYYAYGDALLLQACEDQTLLGGGGGDADDKDDDNDGEGEGQGEGEGEGEEGEATTAGAGEEDTLASGAEGVLQLAWEVLECARLIYSKDPAKTRDLAQVYIKLGEHGQITENYKQALEDFNRALQLREAEAEPDSRSLAELHFLMGLCFTYDKEFLEAQKEYTKAIDFVKTRMAALPEEAAELGQLLPDLEEKLMEVRELQAEKEREEKIQMEMIRGAFQSALSGAAMSSDAFAAPAQQPVVRDLGSLVRKRPAPKPEREREQEGEGESNDDKGKKAKTEPESTEGPQ